jgi:hypothetical protein
LSSPESAIATALNISSADILAWTNHATNGQLKIVCDGDPGVSSVNISVLLIDAHADE